MADGGTVFLDEVGDLDPSSQVKLLRVLQDRSFEVLGSSVTRPWTCRVVSATNRPLPELVARGQFREDLLYRLNLISVRLPALRERPGDIPLLARHFLERAAQTYGAGRAIPRATRQSSGSWPGPGPATSGSCDRRSNAPSSSSTGDLLEADHFRALADLESETVRENELPTPGAMTLDQIEREMIRRCLRHYEGNLTRAAEALGLSRAALYRRLEKHGLDVPRG